MSRDLRIVFMGTPEFAVSILDKLVKNNYNIVGVVTSTDKPCGRGQKLGISDVKKYALENNLNILQPASLKSPEFLKQLEDLNVNLQIVVAFRMLPEVVWKLPKYGTFNLHASLLPNYRGAAPINWAIINGEKKTGVTTFFLNNEIDTGKIIFSEETNIDENETASELHDKLMNIGANLVLKTVNSIETNNIVLTDQSFLEDNKIKNAPKIFKEKCKINWEDSLDNIHNFIRGMSQHPGAWTEISTNNQENIYVKIYLSTKEQINHTYNIGKILTDGKTHLKVSVNGGFINIVRIQQSSKKPMNIEEYLRGIKIDESWKV